ncbi:quinone oxidoreductase [Polaromonas sp.]|uniref:quinone oxidoreductase family protein n=1 Tax=Polaromonas sp. TaxID=1869339 RepID=UPI0032675586
MNANLSQAITRILVSQYGEADVLHIDERAVPAPGAGEIRVRHRAIGVNYVDIYHRRGIYPLPVLPGVPGVEGSGVVEAVGEGVEDWQPGDRVVYAGLPGAYASVRNLPAALAVRLSEHLDADIATAAFMRGITAHMLFAHVRPVQSGDTVLVHAAAGGLGLILVQWAKSLGATVIGTVGSAAKAELALAHGLDQAIVYREQPWVDAVLAATRGKGVEYAIDGIGGQTLQDSFTVTRTCGTVASIGQVAGAQTLLDQSLLATRSLSLAYPSVMRFMADNDRYQAAAADVLARLGQGLRVHIDRVLPLNQAADAHRLLEAGKTAGALLLRPSMN